MNISPIANNLIDMIDDYISISSKKEYRFTLEEQIEMQKAVKRLDRQIDILIDYEMKRTKNEK